MNEKTTLTDQAYRLYKNLCDLREKETQGTKCHERLRHACFLSSRRWRRRHDEALNTGNEIIVNKSNVGRPKKDDKKINIGVKLPPWLNEWMKIQPESKAVLIETALKEYYQIPIGVWGSDPNTKQGMKI